MSARTRIAIFSSVVALLSCAGVSCAPRGEQILLATTTSVQDSGLLDTLVPVFRERTGIRVRVVAVGSGAALRHAGRPGPHVLQAI